MASLTFYLSHIMAIGNYCYNMTPFPHEITTTLSRTLPSKTSYNHRLNKKLQVSWHFEIENALKRDKTKFLYCNNKGSSYLLDNKN